MYSTKYISTNKLSQLDLLHKTLNLKEDITKKNEIGEDIKTKINNKFDEIEAMITELQSDDTSSSITFNNDNESISIQQIPNTSKIGVYKNENIILRIDETGNIYCMNLCPNSIYFGNTDVGQTSKPSGSIVDIVNIDNKEALDNNSLNNKDSYVPSYRVLQENYALKTDVQENYALKTDVQENYALKTDVPTGISFPYTKSSNNTYITSIKQIPNTPNIGMYLNDTEVIRFGNNGYIYSKGIYPGDIIFQQTTGFGTTSAKWTGYIRNIVNSDNKASADDLNDSNKDMLVPSYRVLQENYLLKSDLTNEDSPYNINTLTQNITNVNTNINSDTFIIDTERFMTEKVEVEKKYSTNSSDLIQILARGIKNNNYQFYYSEWFIDSINITVKKYNTLSNGDITESDESDIVVSKLCFDNGSDSAITSEFFSIPKIEAISFKRINHDSFSFSIDLRGLGGISSTYTSTKITIDPVEITRTIKLK